MPDLRIVYTQSVPIAADFNSHLGPALCINQTTGIAYYINAAGAVTAIPPHLDSVGSTQGQILYRGAAAWVALAPGSSGQYLQTQGAAANPQWAAAGGATPHAALGRVTLTSATPVTTANVSAATNIYYTPYAGDLVPIYSGSWTETTCSELTLALDSNAGHTGYHQSGKNFDLWIVNDSGTLRMGTGSAWTNDITVADARTRVNGILLNSASITFRYGSGANDYATVAAQRATLVGTVRMTANGQTEDSETKRFISNLYCRLRRKLKIAFSSSHAYTTNSWRQWNNSATNQVEILNCVSEDAVEAWGLSGISTTSASSAPDFGIGLDATTTQAADALNSEWYPKNTNDSVVWVTARYCGYPGQGYHYITAIEKGDTGGTFWGVIPARAQGGLYGTVIG